MAGTATGHSLPGLVLVAVSLWWIYNMYRNYYKCVQNNTIYKSMTWFPSGKKSNLPLEIIFKLAIISLAIVQEVLAFLYISNSDIEYLHINALHITMLIFFALQAVVELLQLYKVSSIPPDAEYFTASMAFFIEGILFHFHSSGKSPYEALLHTLLIIAIAGSSITVLLEAHFKQNISVSLTRAFFTLLQGTWFFHIGYIMYSSTSSVIGVFDGSKVTGHGEMMITVVHFSWHVAVDLVIVFLIGCLVGWRSRKTKSYPVDSNPKYLGSGEEEFLISSST